MDTYRPPPFFVRLNWNSDPPALLTTAVCECSSLMPQMVLQLDVDTPDEWQQDPFIWRMYLRINPPPSHGTVDRGVPWFEVWQYIEDSGWSSEFSWGADRLTTIDEDADVTAVLDTLHDALLDGVPEAIFAAFAELRGGLIEFAGWQDTHPGHELSDVKKFPA